MRGAALFIAGIACCALLLAQDRPNFVGHWELIRPGVAPAGTVIALDISESGQDPRVLNVTRHFESGGAEMRDYPIGIQGGRAGGFSVGGGIPTANAFQSVTWQTAALLIDQEGEPGPERHERWSLSTTGELVIEFADKPLVLATQTDTVRYRKR